MLTGAESDAVTTAGAGPVRRNPAASSSRAPSTGRPAPDIAIFSPLGRDGGTSHGGITRVVVNLAGAFAEVGKRVELVTFAPDNPLAALPGLHPDVSGFNFPPGGRLGHLLRLRSYLKDRAPAVLLAAGQRPNMIAVWCKRLFAPATRVFLSVHNAPTPGLRQLGTLRRRLRVLAIRLAYPWADGVICVSGGVANDLAGVSGMARERLTVIHNPAVSVESLQAERSRAMHPWLATGQPPVVLGAGRLTRQKDFPTLVRAFAIVAAERDCRLMIIGEGREREVLEPLIDELGLRGRVLLPGFVDDPIGFMGQAALFVLSSAWEGFGNVLVEAMAAGTPVVSTDCPSGPREILRDGELGPLVPVGEPQALAGAMLESLSNPTDPERLRARAADFLDTRVAARYLKRLFGEGPADGNG
jgi:glycosyltransferase involved in cell wall biosynthesis